ncbi:type II secretion system minor pseudopilin GspK, partial [bacterium]|nr:type II secretion system minor pseudopilin GspK [bacterium]
MLTRLRFRGKTGRRKRGIALLIVLLVTAILSVVVLDFAHSTRINLYIASNIADGLKAYYLAKSGLQVAQGALLDDVQKKRKVDHLGEDWNSPLFSYIPLSDNETISVTVTDESSKFNLNQLVGRSGTPRRFEGDWFRNLLALQQIDDPDVVAAIIDWLDSDEEVLGGGGMEDQVYGYSSAQPQAYKSRNGRLLTLAELRLVKGVTDEIYRKLTETCTIFADRKLNMNTIDQRVLQAMIMALDEKADAAGEAQKIVSWRVAGQEEAGKEEQIFDGSGVVSELEAAGVDRNLARKI